MTAHRELKRIVRDRQTKTGESYTTARAHVMRARAELLGLPSEVPATADAARRCDAVVLKVNRQSARVRLLGEEDVLTFRSGDAWMVVPGQVATLTVERRWSWRGNGYASGRIEDPRIDVALLGLEPLPLDDGEPIDLRSHYEPYRDPDPYAPLWRKLTARPRPCFIMDEIAWGAFPEADEPYETPTADAFELLDRGDEEAARDILMSGLLRDLRYIDAHVHLGNLEFDRWPQRAMVHYEMGIRIAELSLPPDFDGCLLWGHVENRPFLRCLHGYGLSLWRLERWKEAQAVFERILSLNPNDNQGVRFCRQDVLHGRSWESTREEEPGQR